MTNEELDSLKKAWAAMGESLGMLSTIENPDKMKNKKTALDRLHIRYQAFSVIVMAMIPCSILAFARNPSLPEGLSYWLTSAYVVYFLAVFCMAQWLCHSLSGIDPAALSVAEVSRMAMLCRKRHLQFMAILIPMAVALVGFTGYAFSSEKYFLSGMVCGAVIGAIIGTIQFRKFMANYKALGE